MILETWREARRSLRLGGAEDAALEMWRHFIAPALSQKRNAPTRAPCAGRFVFHRVLSRAHAQGARARACRDINARPTQTRYRRSHRKQLAGRPYGQLLQDYASPAHFFGEDCDNSAHLYGQLLQDYASPAHFFGEDCDNSAHLYGQLLQDYASPAHFFGEDCDNSAHLFEGQWQPRPSLSTPKKWAGLEHWLNVSLRHHCRTIIQPDSHCKYNNYYATT